MAAINKKSMIKLSNSIDIEFTDHAGYVQNTIPRFLLCDLTVVISKAYSIDQLKDVHIYNPGTSDWMGSDTDSFLFDKLDHSLVHVSVKLPELPIKRDVATDAGFFSGISSFKGAFHLSKLNEPYYVERMKYRVYDVAANILGGVRFENISTLSSSIIYNISPDFYLLFLNNTYAGWILCNAEKYLVSSYEDIPSDVSSPDLKTALEKCMNLITCDNVDLMSDGDLQILTDVGRLYKYINTLNIDLHKKNLIMNWLYNIADWYYQQEQMDRFFK